MIQLELMDFREWQSIVSSAFPVKDLTKTDKPDSTEKAEDSDLQKPEEPEILPKVQEKVQV